jgi:hypothetical protein
MKYWESIADNLSEAGGRLRDINVSRTGGALAVDGMLTLRASKVVVSVRKRSLMCRGKSLVSRAKR